MEEAIQILVNKQFSLPITYRPIDLIMPHIPFAFSSYEEVKTNQIEKKLLRKESALALEKLFRVAFLEHIYLFGVSGFRSYERQDEIYQTNLITKGEEHTKLFSAQAGHSEHQTGLAMDVSCLAIHNRLDEEFAYTPEGKWLKNHCHEFGFILRYPKEKVAITGYAFEPWHIRYVGSDLATLCHNQNITLEEYYNTQV